ncbi:MAG: HAMP domain-containing sensor histidine kinase [Novosphingobium sp.]
MPSWLNSIHVHMIGLSMAVIAALTAISLVLLYVLGSPSHPPVSIYEMSRIVRGERLLRAPGMIEQTRVAQPSRGPLGLAEQVVSMLLAERLGLARDSVQVRLNRDEWKRGPSMAREAALYGNDANPYILGTFSIAVREGRTWRVLTHESLGLFNIWRVTGWNVLLMGSLLVLPLTLWFSARLARPIEAFAASAQRLGGGRAVAPVTIAGPTEIRLAAQSLNDMQARILRFVSERTTLMGAIAHDLRAPLSRLHFHLDGAPPPLQAAAAGEIREMERLIDVILEFVENENRPQVREPLDLSMLVEGVADDFADMGKDVRVTAAEPIVTLGDPLLLKRLFVNIVENAVNYAGSAEIAIRRAGPQAVVEVIDHGRGMSEEELARAFEPFFRGEPSRNRKTGGVGLGLSIVKTAADAHDARVELANAAAGGLVATVSLPIRSLDDARQGGA